MGNNKIPLVDLTRIHQPLQEPIERLLQTVLNSSSFIGGNFVTEFEHAFATYLGIKHCVGCANGTDALELALEALGIGEGDEVIVPAHTWISTASAVARVGATPVFADTEADTFCINPEAAASKITSATKVLLPVHLYGHPCNMDAIMALAKQYNLLVIEDCAQAHGATNKGQKVGTFGDAACFSFYPSKNLGALGDGGAVVCNNEAVAQAIRAIQNCGQQQKNNIVRIGRNSRLDAFQAAVLHLKLQYLDSWNEARRQAAHQLNQALKGLGGITLPEEKPDARHVYHLYVIQCANRQAVEAQLQAANIDWGCHYPFLLHRVFNHKASCPIGEGYIDNILSLPMFPGLTDNEIERIVNALKA